jgi:hypothetical protein
MNLMILKTDEATYEVDLEAKLIRANDGQWQSFVAIGGLAQDEPAVIHWTEADEVAATITSPVRKVTSKVNEGVCSEGPAGQAVAVGSIGVSRPLESHVEYALTT